MPGIFSGFASSFGRSGGERPTGVPLQSSQRSPSVRPSIHQSTSSQFPQSQLSAPGVFGRGPTAGLVGKGLGGKLGLKRRRKVIRDSIYGISKGDIRRIARRGGVKRASGAIYPDIRKVIYDRIWLILNDCSKIVDHRAAKTVTAMDVIFILKRLGSPMYGFGDVDSRPLGKRH